jgi:hypothetical protein
MRAPVIADERSIGIPIDHAQAAQSHSVYSQPE